MPVPSCNHGLPHSGRGRGQWHLASTRLKQSSLVSGMRENDCDCGWTKSTSHRLGCVKLKDNLTKTACNRRTILYMRQPMWYSFQGIPSGSCPKPTTFATANQHVMESHGIRTLPHNHCHPRPGELISKRKPCCRDLDDLSICQCFHLTITSVHLSSAKRGNKQKTSTSFWSTHRKSEQGSRCARCPS